MTDESVASRGSEPIEPITVTLTGEEVDVLCSGLDSYEYWEHRDALNHDSGYVILPEDDESSEYYDDRPLSEDETAAIEAVRFARLLAEKLSAARGGHSRNVDIDVDVLRDLLIEWHVDEATNADAAGEYADQLIRRIRESGAAS